MNHSKRVAVLLLQGACLACGAGRIHAQAIPYVAPTEAECIAAAAALDGGNHDASSWNRLSGCGTRGGNALARALRAGLAETDSIYLLALYNTSASIKDSAVFKAGLFVSNQASATAPARIISLLVGLSQVEPAIGLKLSVGLGSLWSPGVGLNCPFAVYEPRKYHSTTFLSGEAKQQLANRADDVRLSSAPQAVREFAGCVRQTLLPSVPRVINPASISLSYVCGNRFRVENNSADWLKVTWNMEIWSDTGAFDVGPHASFTFSTRSIGSVRLYQNGVFVKSKANGGTTCGT